MAKLPTPEKGIEPLTWKDTKCRPSYRVKKIKAIILILPKNVHAGWNNHHMSCNS